ncbi:MAG TPA: RsmE family RNA methyltransferase [bacterium]|nr:RsmE family RNA methyltransferase [bacterium]
MTYFLHDAPLTPGQTVVLRGEEARHLLGSRRIRTGERFALQDPAGQRFEAELTAADRREAQATILAPLAVPPAPPVRITLLQGVIKDKATETLVETCTALGVAGLCFFAAAHSSVAHKALEAPRARARMERIAWEACKQSDRQFPPSIAMVPSLAAALQAHAPQPAAGTHGWVLHPGAERSAAETLAALSAPAAGAVPPSLAVHVLIGPEGGLTDDEVAAAMAAGYVPIRLGPTTLRAETAALAACALAALGLR